MLSIGCCLGGSQSTACQPQGDQQGQWKSEGCGCTDRWGSPAITRGERWCMGNKKAPKPRGPGSA